MRVYICYPINNEERQKDKEAIERIERDLKAMGHEPVSPLSDEVHYGDAFAARVKKLLSCKAIYLATNWNKSKVCYSEYYISKVHSMKTFYGPERVDAIQKYVIPHE